MVEMWTGYLRGKGGLLECEKKTGRGKVCEIWAEKSYSPLQRLLQRAVVPPRTIRKVAEIFAVPRIFFDFFWGGDC
jgi:serine/threonine-protein kinase RIO1